MIWYWHTRGYRVISVRIIDKKDTLETIFSNMVNIGNNKIKIPEHLDNEVKSLYTYLTDFSGNGGRGLCMIPDSDSIALYATSESNGEMSYFTSYPMANFYPQLSLKINEEQ